MKISALVLISTLATGCYAAGTGPSPPFAPSATAQWPAYDTFSFGWTANPPAGYEASGRSLEVDRRLREIVGAALRQKGYVEDDNNPSVVVRFGAGIKSVVSRVTEEVDPLGVVQDEVRTYEGIQIIVYDAGLKTAVWQGSARSVVNPTREIDVSLLQWEVVDALATFPSRRITASYPFRGRGPGA
ncbi:MAG: DUF4136 domain-containing protein [Polyangiaceae bacterium]